MKLRAVSVYLFFLITIALTPALQGEPASSLEGVITGPDGRSVPGASVILYSRESATRFSARTDAEGRYSFSEIAAGVYLLEVQARGFAGVTTETVELTSDGATRDLSLELSGMQTQVVVTASTTPLMLQEVSKATDTVTVKEMDLRAEYSLAEALRTVPGFRIKEQRGPGGLVSVQVRGMRSYDTALLIDGIRMRDASEPQGSVSPLWSDLMIVTPSRAEVLRGSGSSLYGSHAIGGVVNLVTDQGGGKTHGSVFAEGGGLGFFRGGAKLAGGALHNRFLYSGGLAHLNVTRGLDDVNPYRNTSAQGFGKYLLTPAMAVTGRLLFSDAFAYVGDSPYVDASMEANHPAAGIVPGRPLPDDQVRLIEQGRPFTPGAATYVPSLNDPDSQRAGRSFNMATAFTHQLTPSVSYRASYQYLGMNRRFDDGPAGMRWEPAASSHYNYDSQVHIAGARADIQAGQYNLVSGGYEFESEQFDNLNTDENPDAALRTNDRAKARQNSHSLFIQDQLSFFDRSLQVAFSGRMQSFQLREPEFFGGGSPYPGSPTESPKTAWTGDAAVSYIFRSTGTKWRAHAGNAYRAPSLYERYGSSFFFGMFSPFGDPRLRPERTTAFDTGFDQWLANSRVKLSATYFYTNLRETIIFDFSGLIPVDDPYGRYGGYINFGRGLTRGVETSVTASPAKSTTLNAAYTYTDSRQRGFWDAAGQIDRYPGVSDNVFSLMASQWIGRRINVTFDFFAAGNYLARFSTTGGTRAIELDGPLKADIVARYVLPVGETKTVEFYGKFENISSNNLYEEGYRTPKFWAIGGLRFTY